jgi:YfiH family protein
MVSELFESVASFSEFGVRAFVTRRSLGSLSTSSDEPASVVSARWDRVRAELSPAISRIATLRQVHGAHIISHKDGWTGWLRCESADGHISATRGTALGVSIADCVPTLLAHPSGLVAALHAGWRGIAAGILTRALSTLQSLRMSPRDVRVHFGPAICGKCYEVGKDVYFAVSGRQIPGKSLIDLRAELALKATAAGVREISTSDFCTRCNNDHFFSHRAGDAGRQFAFIVADPP